MDGEAKLWLQSLQSKEEKARRVCGKIFAYIFIAVPFEIYFIEVFYFQFLDYVSLQNVFGYVIFLSSPFC